MPDASRSAQPAFAGWEQRVRESFARQGFMATLGARLASVAPGAVAIELPAGPALHQQHGYVHAGAIASVLDSACGYAALTLLPEDAEVLTVEFKIDLLEPASGDGFVAEGTVVRAGRTLTVCQGRARADGAGRDGPTVAVMTVTMIALRPRGAGDGR